MSSSTNRSSNAPRASLYTAFDCQRIHGNIPISKEPTQKQQLKMQDFLDSFSHAEDRAYYSGWLDSQRLALSRTYELHEYIDRFSNTIYNKPDEVDYLMKLMRSPEGPCIPLGKHLGFEYRLNTKVWPLNKTTPHLYRDLDKEFRDLLPHLFLGLNTRHSAKPFNRLTISRYRPNDDSGFVFFQLGVLESADVAENERERGLVRDNWQWHRTNYVVGAQLNDNSQAEGIWIICDHKNKPVEVISKRYWPRTYHDMELVDLLPSDALRCVRRSAVPIAKTVKDLFEGAKEGKPLSFSKLHPLFPDGVKDFELTAAVLHPGGRKIGDPAVIVRQYACSAEPEPASPSASPIHAPRDYTVSAYLPPMAERRCEPASLSKRTNSDTPDYSVSPTKKTKLGKSQSPLPPSKRTSIRDNIPASPTKKTEKCMGASPSERTATPDENRSPVSPSTKLGMGAMPFRGKTNEKKNQDDDKEQNQSSGSFDVGC